MKTRGSSSINALFEDGIADIEKKSRSLERDFL